VQNKKQCKAGDFAAAEHTQAQIQALTEPFSDDLIANIKAALAEQVPGYPPHVRPPLRDVKPGRIQDRCGRPQRAPRGHRILFLPLPTFVLELYSENHVIYWRGRLRDGSDKEAACSTIGRQTGRKLRMSAFLFAHE